MLVAVAKEVGMGNPAEKTTAPQRLPFMTDFRRKNQSLFVVAAQLEWSKSCFD